MMICSADSFEFGLKLACIFSMISVCLHTPDTIKVFPSLEYLLLIVDLIVTFIFSIDCFLRVIFIFFFVNNFFRLIIKQLENDGFNLILLY